MARTRPRLFSFSREVELGHYDELVRSPEARALLERAVDAFIAICKDRMLPPERLQALVDAAVGPDPNVRMAAMNRLAVLCHYFPAPASALLEIAAHPDPDVRTLCCAAAGNAPPEVTLGVITLLLRDPLWTVRKAAAQLATTVPLPDLSPLVDAAMEERDARVRVVLQLALEVRSS